ncbi:hypothetical protein [Pedobacter aquatilis]|uniref:hypothetical protein n=1 Tax=Pedobacter aquatilis TaxID=351343 RepID=UPI00292DDCA6|nr:hypothetical protein [Pedobacter aquatilis]
MQETIKYSFDINSINGKQYIKMFNLFLNFNPSRFSLKKEGGTWKVTNWKEKYKLEISEAGYLDNFSASQNERFFSVTTANPDSPFISIALSQDNGIISDNDIECFIQNKGFCSAYRYSTNYVAVQDTEYEGNIQGLGYSLKSLRYTPFTIDNSTGVKIYDISNNPGRSFLIGNTWIIAAHKMWFGPGFFKLVPKERLVSFPNASEIKEIENGCLFIKLFDDVEESDSEENMVIQQSWLDWINIKQLSSQYP